MTFLEAAVAILKREGKPLHYKKLTEIALKDNLLTVVGRTPEATMQQRLNDALKKDPSLPLTREKPGIFGLRYYPAPSEKEAAPAAAPSEKEAAPAAGTPAAESGPGEGKRRRRRGGRGRRRGGAGESATPAGEEAAAEGDGEPAAAAEAPSEPAASEGEEPKAPSTEPARHSFADAAAAVAAAHAEQRRAQGESAPAESESEDGEGAFDEEALAEQMDTPSGPLIAPAFGTEELVKGEDHRPVYEGKKRDDRRRGRERGRGHKEHAGQQKPQQAQQPQRPAQEAQRPAEPAREAQPAQPQQQPQQPAPATGAVGSTMDAVFDILRDGRTLHVKQIVDIGLKKRTLRGEPPELWRAVRAGVVAELRAREANGQRPRVRPMGGGNYALGDRRLDGELLQYEREVSDRAARLAEATRAALHRRVSRLSPYAFETFGRLFLEKLGISSVELVKRGDGVAYFGGLRARGNRKSKVLVAIRPGEGELSRRAVGELRAGLKARNFDEGLLIAVARAGAEAQAELAAGAGPVELFDGDALIAASAKLGLGVVRRSMPIESLDVELLTELSEG
jgi:hypothetical protein